MATSGTSIVHASVSTNSPGPATPDDSVSSAPIGPPSPSAVQLVALTGPSTQSTGTTPSNNSLPTVATIAGPHVGAQAGRASASGAPTHSPTAATTHTLGDFLWTAGFGNVLGAVVLVLTVTGLGWTFGAGTIGLDLQKWTARNDALQSCLSWEIAGHYSRYCNDTIESGVTRPPLVKRMQALTAPWSFVDRSTIWAYQSALLITVTLCVGVFTLVYLRPRMHPFRPVISSVRTHLPQKVFTWKILPGNTPHVTIKSIQDIEDALRDLATIFRPEAGNFGHIVETEDLGQRIGVFYDSEGDRDTGSDTGTDEYDVRFIGGGPSLRDVTATVPRSIVAEKRPPNDVDANIIAELQGHHAYLMDWFWRQDPDDKTLRNESNLERSKLRRFTTDEFCAACTDVRRKLEVLQEGREEPEEPQVQSVPTVTQSVRHSYLWAIIREISQRTKPQECTTLSSQKSGTDDEGFEWNTLLSRWHECVEDLRSLKDRCSKAILRAGPRPVCLYIDVGNVLRGLDYAVNFAEDVSHDEESHWATGLSIVCRSFDQKFELKEGGGYKFTIPHCLQQCNHSDILTCAQSLRQRAMDTLAVIENPSCRKAALTSSRQLAERTSAATMLFSHEGCLFFGEDGSDGNRKLLLLQEKGISRQSLDELRKSWCQKIGRIESLFNLSYRRHGAVWLALKRATYTSRLRRDVDPSPEDVLRLCPILAGLGLSEDTLIDLSMLYSEVDTLACVLSWLFLLEQEVENGLDADTARLPLAREDPKGSEEPSLQMSTANIATSHSSARSLHHDATVPYAQGSSAWAGLQGCVMLQDSQVQDEDLAELWRSWHKSIGRLESCLVEAKRKPGWASAHRPWLAIGHLIEFSHSLESDRLRPEDLATLWSILASIPLFNDLRIKLSQLSPESELLACLVPWLLTLEQQATADLVAVFTRLEAEQRDSIGYDHALQAVPLEPSPHKPVTNGNKMDHTGSGIDNPPDTGNSRARQSVPSEQPNDKQVNDADEINRVLHVDKPPKKAARSLDSFMRFSQRAEPTMKRPSKPGIRQFSWVETPYVPRVYPQIWQEYGSDLNPAELE